MSPLPQHQRRRQRLLSQERPRLDLLEAGALSSSTGGLRCTDGCSPVSANWLCSSGCCWFMPSTVKPPQLSRKKKCRGSFLLQQQISNPWSLDKYIRIHVLLPDVTVKRQNKFSGCIPKILVSGRAKFSLNGRRGKWDAFAHRIEA